MLGSVTFGPSEPKSSVIVSHAEAAQQISAMLSDTVQIAGE